MYLEIDLGSVPPDVSLREGEDLTSFSARVNAPSHTFITPQTLRKLAGDLADDPQWTAQLEAMLAYAGSKGWLREDGAVRAHVEVNP